MTIYTKHGARRGVTLIEAVLFISIALGLIVGGLVFFQQAQLAARTNDAVRSISGFASEVRAAYRTQDNFTALTEGVLISSGAVPGSQVSTTATGCSVAAPCILNEWNQTVLVRQSTPALAGLGGFQVFTGTTTGVVLNATNVPAGQFFQITYSNIPVAACTRLATANQGSGPIGPGIVAVYVRDASSPLRFFPAGTVSNANGATNVSLNGQVNISPAAAAAACGAGTAPMDLTFILDR